jgi:hypothetical protein
MANIDKQMIEQPKCEMTPQVDSFTLTDTQRPEM